MSSPTRAQLQFLLRAYQSGKSEFGATSAANWFAERAGIGIFSNRKWRWQASDRMLVRQYLIVAMGITDPDNIDGDFADISRIEAAGLVVDEKHGSRGPRDGRVLMRGTRGAICINGVTSTMTGSACLDLHVDEIESIDHDCLVFVENFEALINFEQMQLSDFPYTDPLLVYRGDAINPTNGAKSLATASSLPVVAFTDLDPQGLNIARSLPNTIGAIFPIEVGGSGHYESYLCQQHLLGPIEKYPASWRAVIQAMCTVRRGISQEYMIARRVPCRLYC